MRATIESAGLRLAPAFASFAFLLHCAGQLEPGGPGEGAGADGAPVGAPPEWDGGLLTPTSPGTIRCGTTTCGPTEQCCLVGQGDPATNGCGSRDQPVCNGSQVTRTCEKQSDCQSDEVCCYSFWSGPPVTLGSVCETREGGAAPPDCNPGCATNADCASIGAPDCVSQVCRGDILQTCGRLPTVLCPP